MAKTKVLKLQAAKKTATDNGTQKKIFQLGILCLLIVSLIWVYRISHDPHWFPIKKIAFVGSFQHLSKHTLETRTLPLIHKQTFWSVDLAEIQQQLQALPWVAEVEVERAWPGGIKIYIQEQKPFAVWNQNALLNPVGDIFAPPKTSFPSNLPYIDAPSGFQLSALSLFKSFSAMLMPVGLTIVHLNINARGSVDLYLSNQLHVILGDESNEQRLQRFLAVYSKLIQPQIAQIDTIDLRYANGLSIQWKTGVMHNGKKE